MRARWRGAIERWLLNRWFSNRPAGLIGGALGLVSRLTDWYSRRQRQSIVDYSNRVRQGRQAGHRRPCVIVVGNLVAGGAGKTPLVLALARALRERGLSVGIIGHAYRASDGHAQRIGPGSDPRRVGDEAVLLALESGLPCAAGRDRESALQRLLDIDPGLQVVIADDGLQHVGLARDIELAVFDSRGAGNGRLLPAGPLREPLEHLAQMNALVINSSEQSSVEGRLPRHDRTYRYTIEPAAIVSLTDFFEPAAPVLADDPAIALRSAVALLQAMPRERRVAVAGIGNPRRFEETLARLGLTTPVQALGDHEAVSAAWLAAVDADIILMTSKDAVKLRDLPDPRCRVVRVAAVIDPAMIDWLTKAVLAYDRPAPASPAPRR